MASKEQEQPKKSAGYEFFKDVAWFSLALFAGAVALKAIGHELGFRPPR